MNALDEIRLEDLACLLCIRKYGKCDNKEHYCPIYNTEEEKEEEND